MQKNTTRFSRLVDLAKETSSEKRRDLLRQVSDVFLEGSLEFSDVERSHFGDIIGKVSANMDVAVRRRLAEQFAGQPNPTCAESGFGAHRINDLAWKSALHFWFFCGVGIVYAVTLWSATVVAPNGIRILFGSTIPRRSSNAV